MAIKDKILNLFEQLAVKLGLQLQEKTKTELDYSAVGFNPTAIGASIVSGIAIDDSEIKIAGNNARAEKLRELLDEYVGTVRDVNAEICLGKGGSIVRPYTSGTDIGFNIIDSDNYVITSSVGRTLKGVIMKLDSYKTQNAEYTLCEAQTLDTEKNIVTIKRYAYNEGNEIPIESTNWAGIVPEQQINADQLLLGWYRCPTVNRTNVNSADGVPITYGCDDLIDETQDKIGQFNEEFNRKVARTFADRTLFKQQNDKGKTSLKLTDSRSIVQTNTPVNGTVNDLMHDYSPEIRNDSFESGINQNLVLLEMAVGLSRGIFTKSDEKFVTATEIKNSRLKTFMYVKKFRRQLEFGDRMLFHALDIILNAGNIVPMGEWDMSFDWSYGYIQESKERFSQLMQGHSAGVVSDEDLASWILNLDEEEKEEYIAKLKEKETLEVNKMIDDE